MTVVVVVDVAAAAAPVVLLFALFSHAYRCRNRDA